VWVRVCVSAVLVLGTSAAHGLSVCVSLCLVVVVVGGVWGCGGICFGACSCVCFSQCGGKGTCLATRLAGVCVCAANISCCSCGGSMHARKRVTLIEHFAGADHEIVSAAVWAC